MSRPDCYDPAFHTREAAEDRRQQLEQVFETIPTLELLQAVRAELVARYLEAIGLNAADADRLRVAARDLDVDIQRWLRVDRPSRRLPAVKQGSAW